ncbi:MAG: hypothetical protein GXO79_06195 [Chlorobi bacterium]|nr:hypothetical protein [Chlorobiota bacterium]
MKHRFIILIISILYSSALFSQGDIENRETMFIDSRTVGLHLSSNGYGGDFRYQKWLDSYKKRLYSIDIVTLKDPKEYKISNPRSIFQKQFIFGKMNSVFNLRAGLGMQKKLFSKMDKGGIEINYFYQFGPNIAFLKPIYYIVTNYSTQVSTYEKFDPINVHSLYDIDGKASFFKGINETTIRPGAFVKFGFNFEFSPNDKLVKYIEAGGTIDIFQKNIPIMAIEKTNFIFFSLFVYYRFGKNVNVRVSKKYQKEHPEEYENKIKMDDIRF